MRDGELSRRLWLQMRWEQRIGQRLKLRDLHILMAVIERGSMARAATALAISQPAVSKAVASMEHTFGVTLLERSRSGVQPTAYGKALVKRGLVVFDELREGVSELKLLADPTIGSLRIGSSEAIAAGLLPRIIDDLSRAHAGITFDVTQALFNTSAYREVRDRTVDLLIGRVLGPVQEEDLAIEYLFDDEIVIVAASGSPLHRVRSLRLADLNGERWIFPPPETRTGELTAELFRKAGATVPRAPLRTLSIHLALQLVATGRFVAVLPSSVLRFGLGKAPIKALALTLPRQARPVGIITLKHRTMSPVAELFLRHARAAVMTGKRGRKRL
jgi:DNA-binding transcriptional LysR family regulator